MPSGTWAPLSFCSAIFTICCFVFKTSRWLLHIQQAQHKCLKHKLGREVHLSYKAFFFHLGKEDFPGTSPHTLKVSIELYQPHLAASLSGKWNISLLPRQLRKKGFVKLLNNSVCVISVQHRLSPVRLIITFPPWPLYQFAGSSCHMWYLLLLLSAKSGHCLGGSTRVFHCWPVPS